MVRLVVFMRYVVVLKMLIFASLSCSPIVIAQIEHISLNQRLFELGKLPMAKINIVASSQDVFNLEFILVQEHSEERLIVQPLNQFSLLLMGLDKVTDVNAKIVVRQWSPVKNLDLFDKDEIKQFLTVSGANREQEVVEGRYATMKELSSIINQDIVMQNSDLCLLDYNGNQTLWSLGSKYAKLWSTNIYSASLVIFYANLNAFNKGGINGLRKDAILRCPDEKLLSDYGEPAMAKELYNKLTEHK